MENILLFYTLKVKDHCSTHFNHENHELIVENMIHGIAGENLTKYDTTMFELFSNLFSKLSLCHIFAKTGFTTHGSFYLDELPRYRNTLAVPTAQWQSPLRTLGPPEEQVLVQKPRC